MIRTIVVVGTLLLGIGAVAAQQDIVAIHEISPEKAGVETLFIRRHDAYISSAMRAFVEVSRSALGPLMAAA